MIHSGGRTPIINYNNHRSSLWCEKSCENTRIICKNILVTRHTANKASNLQPFTKIVHLGAKKKIVREKVSNQ